MPRCARIKNENSIYHIMVRSISEIDLFKNTEDKERYLSIIKKYKFKYQFKLYAYCLMDNHGHFIIDCNGADISKIMHGINSSYVKYYNKKYRRHGHLFQDRFKSKIVDSDRYAIALSLYIHNNPKDIYEYKDCVEKYQYSSLKDYVNNQNYRGILDKHFLKELLNLNSKESIKNYLTLVIKCEYNREKLDIDVEFEENKTEYRTGRKIITRQNTVEKVIDFISNYSEVELEDKNDIYLKYNRKYTEIRAICCFLINCFCNINQRQLCNIFGNITQSRVSKLCFIGIDKIKNNNKYKNILNDFIQVV